MTGEGVGRFVECEPDASRFFEALWRKRTGDVESFEGEGSGCKATFPPPPPPPPFEVDDDVDSILSSLKLGFGGNPATPNPDPIDSSPRETPSRSFPLPFPLSLSSPSSLDASRLALPASPNTANGAFGEGFDLAKSLRDFLFVAEEVAESCLLIALPASPKLILARVGAARVAVELEVERVGFADFPSSFSPLAAPIPLILILVAELDAAGGTAVAIEGGGGEVERGCSMTSPSSSSRDTGIRAMNVVALPILRAHAKCESEGRRVNGVKGRKRFALSRISLAPIQEMEK